MNEAVLILKRDAGGRVVVERQRFDQPWNHGGHEFHEGKRVRASWPQKSAKCTKILGEFLLRSLRSFAAGFSLGTTKDTKITKG